MLIVFVSHTYEPQECPDIDRTFFYGTVRFRKEVKMNVSEMCPVCGSETDRHVAGCHNAIHYDSSKNTSMSKRTFVVTIFENGDLMVSEIGKNVDNKKESAEEILRHYFTTQS